MLIREISARFGLLRVRWRIYAPIAVVVVACTSAFFVLGIGFADTPTTTLGVSSADLYVGSDGGDSADGTGPDFSGTAIGVNAGNGNLVVHEIDDPIADSGSSTGANFSLDRWYNSDLESSGDLGTGWSTGLGSDVRLDLSNSPTAVLYAPSEHAITFNTTGPGPYAAADDPDYSLTQTPTGGWEADNATNGRSFVFDSSGNLQSINDSASGESETFSYTSAGGKNELSAVQGPTGTNTRLSYNGSGQIIEADDPASQHGYYTYNGNLLVEAQHPNGATSTYGYTSGSQLNSITRGSYSASITYDSTGRVHSLTETTDGASETVTLTYLSPQTGVCDPTRDASQTNVTSTATGTTASYCFFADGSLDADAAETDFPTTTIPLNGDVWTLGDPDGNGAASVVLTDPSTGDVSVLPGNGDGTFGSAESFGSLGQSTAATVSGNVGDPSFSDPDAIQSTDDLVGVSPEGSLVVGFSDGFSVSTSQDSSSGQTTWPSADALHLADIDGDGNADLWSQNPVNGNINVALGSASGFGAATTWGNVPLGDQIVMEDVDGDGQADLVTYDPATGHVSVSLAGASQFGNAEQIGTLPTGGTITAGDLTGSDPALYFEASDNTVTSYPITDSGDLGAPVTLGSLPAGYTMSSADLTGEGSLDVVGTEVSGGNLNITGIDVAAIPGVGQ